MTGTKGEGLLKQGNFLQLCLQMCLPSVIVMLVTIVCNIAGIFAGAVTLFFSVMAGILLSLKRKKMEGEDYDK